MLNLVNDLKQGRAVSINMILDPYIDPYIGNSLELPCGTPFRNEERSECRKIQLHASSFQRAEVLVLQVVAPDIASDESLGTGDKAK